MNKTAYRVNWIAAILLSLTVCTVWTTAQKGLHAAPVPFSRPHKSAIVRPSMVGWWVMEWCGIKYLAGFGPGGEFRYLGCNEEWVDGTWELNGDRLTVHERYANGGSYTWSVVLAPGKLAGQLTACNSQFALEK